MDRTAIESNPYLNRLVAQSKLIHDQIEAYYNDERHPHPYMIDQWSKRMDCMQRNSVNILRSVFRIKLPEELLTEIVVDVTMGLSLHQAATEIQYWEHLDETQNVFGDNREYRSDDDREGGSGGGPDEPSGDS